jgi:hypothetical protein
MFRNRWGRPITQWQATKGPAGMVVALIALGLVMLIWVLTWDGAGQRPG